ncbi:hypothetical protein EVAR_21586_1 [Eumeta japonica]|uniref:Mariner Mos1 transposase n=1 Tax=Eumeta variegata TaxID=151549 RepID=A0A4C1UXG4_EUMVA|nr:hypothetical protein EVAR_21586_1 [Eumeta japonica]
MICVRGEGASVYSDNRRQHQCCTTHDKERQNSDLSADSGKLMLFGAAKRSKDSPVVALYDIVAGDEIWTYCYDVESKRQSAQWVFPFEKFPTNAKRDRNIGKKMVAFSFGMTGMKILTHPPYNLDPVPCDFYLFPKIKEKLLGKWFTDTEEAVTAHEKAIGMIPKSIRRPVTDISRLPLSPTCDFRPPATN